MAQTKRRRRVADPYVKEAAQDSLVDLLGLVRQAGQSAKTRIPSELLEPAMVYLIGSDIQSALNDSAARVEKSDNFGPTTYRGTTLERLHALMNRLSAFCSFASQVGAVHASLACSNLEGKISNLIRLEKQKPGSVVQEWKEIENAFAEFAKTGKLPPKRSASRGSKGRKTPS